MQATTTGANRTGEAVSPEGVQAMTEAVLRYSPPTLIDTSASDQDHALYIAAADAVGSVPPPASLKGSFKTGVGKLMGERPELLFDKIGERIAFERAGTRLYDALIVKYQAAVDAGSQLPSIAEAMAASGEKGALPEALQQELPMQTLQRIRDEELQHFHLLCQAMRRMGGDPTAQTPCADAAATANAGIMQVITDPRTTLAQSLNALLTAELADNAGWELLIELTEQVGEDELTGVFLGALAQEARHEQTVRHWLSALLRAEHGSVLV